MSVPVVHSVSVRKDPVACEAEEGREALNDLHTQSTTCMPKTADCRAVRQRRTHLEAYDEPPAGVVEGATVERELQLVVPGHRVAFRGLGGAGRANL